MHWLIHASPANPTANRTRPTRRRSHGLPAPALNAIWSALALLGLAAALIAGANASSGVGEESESRGDAVPIAGSERVELASAWAAPKIDPIDASAIASVPAAQPTPTHCTQRSGLVLEIEVSDVRPLPVRIYLPPCYDERSDERYPSLYLLHGWLRTDRQWLDLGLQGMADALISEKAMPAAIIILPWHRTGIHLEQAIPEVLVPYVDANYRTRSEPEWRAIGGISRGGGQALEIGLRNPGLFGVIGLHSPAVAYHDSVILNWYGSIPLDARPALWVDIGDRDSLYPAARSLLDSLQAEGIHATQMIDHGTHDEAYWRQHLGQYLRWYGGIWLAADLRERAWQQP